MISLWVEIFMIEKYWRENHMNNNKKVNIKIRYNNRNERI